MSFNDILDIEIQENFKDEYEESLSQFPDRPFLAMIFTYIESLSHDINYASSITFYLIDVFFGIHTRIWKSCKRVLPSIIEEELSQSGILNISTDDINNIGKRIIKQYDRSIRNDIIDHTKGQSPYIQICESSRLTRTITEDEIILKAQGFTNTNIIIDLLFVNENHFQVIKWPPRDKLIVVSNDTETSSRAPASFYNAIKPRKGNQRAFHYDEEVLPPLFNRCRKLKTHTSLAKELDDHLNYLKQQFLPADSIVEISGKTIYKEFVSFHQLLKDKVKDKDDRDMMIW
jgi:hypothetical protein